MPPVRGPRVPLAALLGATGCDRAMVDQLPSRWGLPRARYDPPNDSPVVRPCPHTALAALVGVSRRTVVRWAVDGIPLESAEDAAFAAGSHPVAIWGDDWLAACGVEVPPVSVSYEQGCEDPVGSDA